MIPLINRHNESECNISALKNNLIVDMWSLFFFFKLFWICILLEKDQVKKNRVIGNCVGNE